MPLAPRQPACRSRDGDSSPTESLLQQVAEPWVLIDELLDQVVVLFQRNQLERRSAIDGDYHRLAMTEMSIAAQFSLGFTQWNDFHGR